MTSPTTMEMIHESVDKAMDEYMTCQLTYVEGDIFELYKEYDVALQGNNCFCTWGAGFAKSAKNMWPEAYIADMGTAKGNTIKLGKVSGGVDEDGIVLLNCYTQIGYGRDKRHFDYNAWNDICILIGKRFKGKRIIMPRVGSGLAGGDWSRIEEIMLCHLKGISVTVVTQPTD